MRRRTLLESLIRMFGDNRNPWFHRVTRKQPQSYHEYSPLPILQSNP